MSAPRASTKPPSAKSALERFLDIFTQVRAGEGATALLLTANIFLLLTAYYVIKPVREALILALESGPQFKSYLSAAIAVTLIGAVPVYSKFADRVTRNRLVVGVTLFFALDLALFYAASHIEGARAILGIVFYVWVGLFNMMVVAQFWAFANDIYTEEQGERLFALVGVGASVGAAFGSLVVLQLISEVHVFPMLLLAGVILLVSAALFQIVHVRESRHNEDARAPAARSQTPLPSNLTKATNRHGFALVAQNRYLLFLAGFSLIFTLVNTNGEYMLSVLVKAAAEQATQAAVSDNAELDFMAQFYGSFYLLVNVLGVLIQSFLVSRIVRFGGLRIAFFVFPLIALGSAVAVAIVPLLAVLRWGKVAENATDYSLNNTLRQVLWLPTTREMKYKAKQAVDTFFVRMGDVGSAIMVAGFAQILGWGVRQFAIINIGLIGIWLVLAVQIIRENRKLRKQSLGTAQALSATTASS